MASSGDTLDVARAVAESILNSPKIAAFDEKGVMQKMAEMKISGKREVKGKKLEKKAIENDDDEEKLEASDGCILFVGDLARNINEEDLRAVFLEAGDVVHVDIKKDKVTFNNLGYGFVQFKSRAHAQHARAMLNGREIGGRKIRLGWAQKNTTLFVGDLDNGVTTEQLRDIFAKFGPIVKEETFVKGGSGKFVSHGFVRFRHRCDAERAKAEMNRKIIGSRAIRIGWGDNNIQKHCVHVQFNPNQGGMLTEEDFKDVFQMFGEVASVNLPRYTNKRLKGYGFVHYADSNEGERSAGKAIATLADNSRVRDVPIRCSYGKRQIFNRYRRMAKIPQFGTPPLEPIGSPARDPLMGNAWVVSMGPSGQWQPVPVSQAYSPASPPSFGLPNLTSSPIPHSPHQNASSPGLSPNLQPLNVPSPFFLQQTAEGRSSGNPLYPPYHSYFPPVFYPPGGGYNLSLGPAFSLQNSPQRSFEQFSGKSVPSFSPLVSSMPPSQPILPTAYSLERSEGPDSESLGAHVAAPSQESKQPATTPKKGKKKKKSA